MGSTSQNSSAVWALARRQHDAVKRAQLLDLGYSRQAIEHRLWSGRLHRTPWRGVYAVGRPELTRLGFLMAAVLASGVDAALSHVAAAELWGIRGKANEIDVTVPTGRAKRRGIKSHRRTGIATTT